MVGERELGEISSTLKNMEIRLESLERQTNSNAEFMNKWRGVVGFIVVCAAVGGFVLSFVDKIFKH